MVVRRMRAYCNTLRQIGASTTLTGGLILSRAQRWHLQQVQHARTHRRGASPRFGRLIVHVANKGEVVVHVLKHGSCSGEVSAERKCWAMCSRRRSRLLRYGSHSSLATLDSRLTRGIQTGTALVISTPWELPTTRLSELELPEELSASATIRTCFFTGNMYILGLGATAQSQEQRRCCDEVAVPRPAPHVHEGSKHHKHTSREGNWITKQPLVHSWQWTRPLGRRSHRDEGGGAHAEQSPAC